MAQIFIGSDHAGYELKEFLINELRTMGHAPIDCGCPTPASCDYGPIAENLCKSVLSQNGQGILICGTGLGMSMAANRFKGIRAALCTAEIMARMARRHNNANVLCLGSRIIGRELAIAILAAFLESNFEGGRHQRRIDQIEHFSI